MFDEKSGVWIKIYRIYTIVMFWVLLIVGFILCCVAWSDELYIIEDYFLNGLLFLLAGAFLAFTQLIINMLIIQLLNNIQQIRQKVDKM